MCATRAGKVFTLARVLGVVVVLFLIAAILG